VRRRGAGPVQCVVCCKRIPHDVGVAVEVDVFLLQDNPLFSIRCSSAGLSDVACN
jgi:hypothetical protein